MQALSDAVTLRAAEGTISLRRDHVLHADVGLSSALIDLVRTVMFLCMTTSLVNEDRDEGARVAKTISCSLCLGRYLAVE